jgi:DNA-binding transcriptional ArsR family regulator
MIYSSNQEKLERAARCLRALAHPTRLLIVHHLSRRERRVSELEKLIGTSQSNISQHLNIMKDKGLLSSRRDGNLVYYRLRNPRLVKFAALIQELFCQ